MLQAFERSIVQPRRYSLFEGGISVAAFVSGGFLPPAVRGTVNNGIVHIADWYATFLSFSHLDPTDKRAAAAGNIPPIDRSAQTFSLPCSRWMKRKDLKMLWLGAASMSGR